MHLALQLSCLEAAGFWTIIAPGATNLLPWPKSLVWFHEGLAQIWGFHGNSPKLPAFEKEFTQIQLERKHLPGGIQCIQGNKDPGVLHHLPMARGAYKGDGMKEGQ